MFSRLATFVVLAWSAVFASATITILAPSQNYWWIANSQNLYSWTCGAAYNGGYTNFTVLITNQSPSLFNGPLALVSIQWDYDCSVLLPATSVSLPVGTGYVLSFANVFNQTDIIASSSPFEVKAEGSAYAPQPSGVSSATVTASVSATGSASTASATTSMSKSGAISHPHAGCGIVATLATLIAAGLMM